MKDDDPNAAPLLDGRGLYRFFRVGEDETAALRGVDIRVRRGETVAVIGPSGSGKSTLLACLAGLDEPSGGAVHVGGTRISHRPEAERSRLRARHVGILLQSGTLIRHLSVRDNIRLARAADRHGRHRPVTELLDQVELSHRADALPQELSGGELARAGLAAALANDPDVVLADEPTGELDGDSEQRVLQILRRRANDGRAVLLVTHSSAALSIADRVITLHDGRNVDERD
ncbi:ABC transporter ATP-binding protein [Streptomyces montanisoli]|uniref:ATP-binding cassette domain-containing protein n=1 Tax=Streptomyces montanisoli TaxID=2798581 RepID=A0A940RXW5_9ACTN|nr:ATP-binding cassette domain-containing protein [Streptomyces montanisoli]MBP0458558.1 ATP-binding cassette domain-containing protein [Streptomyces montanisoli]